MAGESGTVAVLAEKPSVARDIAKVLGATTRGEGYLHGNGYVVTWAIGHLAIACAAANGFVRNGSPGGAKRCQCCRKRGRWSSTKRPKISLRWCGRFCLRRALARVICATDAGREGELIFRYIYEAAECSKPISRLWISSLTPEAIRKGFDAIKPGKRLRAARGCGARAQPGRLAGGHESFARLHADLWR